MDFNSWSSSPVSEGETGLRPDLITSAFMLLFDLLFILFSVAFLLFLCHTNVAFIFDYIDIDCEVNMAGSGSFIILAGGFLVILLGVVISVVSTVVSSIASFIGMKGDDED